MKKFFTTLLLLSVYGYSFAAQGYVSKDVAKVDWRFRRWTNTTTKTQTLTPTITTTPSITMTPSPSMTGTHGILLSTTPSNTPVYTDTPVYTNTPTVTKTNTLTPENMEQADLSVWLKLTETPTWVPSMTPSPTLSPTPYIVQNLQSARPITLSVSAFGNGGTIYGSSATLLGVPASFYICRATAPDGLGGPTTYIFLDGFGPGFMGFNAPTSITSSALMYTRTGSGSVIQVGAVNVTPTPNITPSPCIFIVQPRY